MRNSIWLLFLCGWLAAGCGDDDGGDATLDGGVDAGGTGGASGFGGRGGPAGTGGFFSRDGGVASTPFDAGCFGMGCGCMVCGAPGCLNCGFGCTCDAPMPQPLPWDPPFDSLGAVGWHASSVPLCTGIDEVASLDVWSDERGVFAMISGHGNPPNALEVEHDEDAGAAGQGGTPIVATDGGFAFDSYGARTEVWLNDGEGWRLDVEDTSRASLFSLTGIPDSTLFLNEWAVLPPEVIGFDPRPCSLGLLEAGWLECLDLDPVQSVHVVGPRLAYAIMGGTRLLQYDGDRWRSSTSLIPYPTTAVWGDRDSVVAVGRAGTVLWLDQGSWSLEDPGTLDNLTSVWGTSRSDVWAGAGNGRILHYDGASWTEVGQLGGVTCDYRPPVTGIWGTGNGVVYFNSDTHLARWNGSELETLANWSCSAAAGMGALRMTGLWGHADDEVFVAIVDGSRFSPDMCGRSFIVHYDGESFHRM